MYYYGSHFGSIDDNYIGSGVYFKHAYKIEPHNFHREIIELYTINSSIGLLKLEEKYLTEIAEVGNKDRCYNLCSNAGGGNVLNGKTDAEIKDIHAKISKTLKSKTPKEREISKFKLNETLKLNPEKLRKRTEKQKETKRNWTIEQRNAKREKLKATIQANPETRKNVGIQRKAYLKNLSPAEYKRCLQNSFGKWSAERKAKFKEKLKIKREALTDEQIAIRHFNKSQARINLDPTRKAALYKKAAETFKTNKLKKITGE
jgi:hypothetical protein